jgi:hypothetical protein
MTARKHLFAVPESAGPDELDDGIEVLMTEHPLAGALSFYVQGPPTVTLVVWDAESDMHEPGEVWGLFVDGRPPRASDRLDEQIDALVFAARAHYSRALHVLADQRGLSAVESRVLACAGLQAAA